MAKNAKQNNNFIGIRIFFLAYDLFNSLKIINNEIIHKNYQYLDFVLGEWQEVNTSPHVATCK